VPQDLIEGACVAVTALPKAK